MKNNTIIIEKTLEAYNAGVKVIRESKGATVTRYEVIPNAGVRVSRICNLERELAIALNVKNVRIEASAGYLGIELENDIKDIVSTKEMLIDDKYNKESGSIVIALGKDIENNNVYVDLSTMPHVIIAGTTGSGKSVCINSIITSIITKYTEQQVELSMVDPKMVELSKYNGIPHLTRDVVTTTDGTLELLVDTVKEMERRYNIFAQVGVENIEAFNEIHGDAMPKRVLIIDELADIMERSGKETEEAICRIAQLGRASGIYMVVATQTPRASIITGRIKANIPSKISFAVTSKTESRVVLDSAGAEALAGNGDMLFLPVGQSKPTRIQGCYISNEDCREIANNLKEQVIEENEVECLKEVKTRRKSNRRERKERKGTRKALLIALGVVVFMLIVAQIG